MVCLVYFRYPLKSRTKPAWSANLCLRPEGELETKHITDGGAVSERAEFSTLLLVFSGPPATYPDER